MVFSSSIFLFLFFPVIFLLNLLLHKKFSNYLLLFGSLIFYAWGEPVCVFIMLGTILCNHLAARLMYRSEGGRRKLILGAAVVLDLLVLGYYKYAGFFLSSLNRLFAEDVFTVPEERLPIGISFFIFQGISFLMDIYRKDTDDVPTLTETALYISFFPQLIAGPIVKYREVSRQLRERQLTADGIARGFRRFLYGLAKKVLIANVLGLYADKMFGVPAVAAGSPGTWIGILAYTFQIYYDFSGYSDMAIGLGLMFGFTFPENFNYPYLSCSVTEFWRRWHMTLGSWFREYLYFPLGGSRKGKLRRYVNLLIVFLCTGLWHGASYSFIFWGLYHGFFTVLERLLHLEEPKRFRFAARLRCFFVVLIGWVFFRSATLTDALLYLKEMFSFTEGTGLLTVKQAASSLKLLFVGIAAVLGMGVLQSLMPEKLRERFSGSLPEALYLTVLFFLCLAAIAGDTYNPFIYYQF